MLSPTKELRLLLRYATIHAMHFGCSMWCWQLKCRGSQGEIILSLTLASVTHVQVIICMCLWLQGRGAAYRREARRKVIFLRRHVHPPLFRDKDQQKVEEFVVYSSRVVEESEAQILEVYLVF